MNKHTRMILKKIIKIYMKKNFNNFCWEKT